MKKFIVSLVIGVVVAQAVVPFLEGQDRPTPASRKKVRVRRSAAGGYEHATRELAAVAAAGASSEVDDLADAVAGLSVSKKRQIEESDGAGVDVDMPNPAAMMQRRAVGSDSAAGPTVAAVAPTMLNDLHTVFLQKVAEGDVAAVHLVLVFQRAVIDLEVRDDVQRTALHLAAAAGHGEIVSMLLAAGAKIDRRDVDGNTPLLLAAIGGHVESARLLLEAGANIFAENKQCLGITPICPRVMPLNDAMNQLIQDYVSPWISMIIAAASQNFACMHECLNDALRGVARNNFYEAPYETFWVPLYEAAQNGDLALLVTLLPNEEQQASACLFTALMVSAMAGRSDIISALIEVGANVNERTYHGWTALYVAAWVGQDESIRTLLDRGADVNARATGGYTPLHMAVFYGSVSTVSLLLKSGANHEEASLSGVTPLDVAMLRNDNDKIKLLQQHAQDHDQCGICLDLLGADRGSFDTCLRCVDARHNFHAVCIAGASAFDTRCPGCVCEHDDSYMNKNGDHK